MKEIFENILLLINECKQMNLLHYCFYFKVFNYLQINFKKLTYLCSIFNL